MKGTCDSCDCVAELFELPGRNDKNCAQCDADLSTMIVLYETLHDNERKGTLAEEIEEEVADILIRYLARCGLQDED